MWRFVSLTLAITLAIGINAASAQTGGDIDSKARSVAGVVKAVSASSFTLKSDGREMMLAVDPSTRIFAKGRPEDYRNPERKRTLTDFVKAGDRVTVRYLRSGSARTAVEVWVLQSGAAPLDVTPPTLSGTPVRQ
jgi:hypothetical protein